MNCDESQCAHPELVEGRARGLLQKDEKNFSSSWTRSAALQHSTSTNSAAIEMNQSFR